MSLFDLDTDTLSLYRRGQPLVVQRMFQQSLNTLATTAITVEEQLTGWYTLLRQQKVSRAIGAGVSKSGGHRRGTEPVPLAVVH